MHAYRRFVQTEMDKRGWTAADLQRSSGLTKQNLSRLLRDDREQLQQRPDAATVTSLAGAFGVTENVVLSHVAEAMGLPTTRVEVAAAADLSNEELLRILAERLNGGGTNERTTPPAEPDAAPAGDNLADRTVPNGATTPRVDIAFDERPWEQDDFDMAAKRGRNRGREARQQQDRAAEDGGA